MVLLLGDANFYSAQEDRHIGTQTPFWGMSRADLGTLVSKGEGDRRARRWKGIPGTAVTLCRGTELTIRQPVRVLRLDVSSKNLHHSRLVSC